MNNVNNIKSGFGVYYSTLDSEEYYFIYEDLKFYFSSLYNLNRFKEKLSSYLYEENSKINNRYKVKIDLTIYLMLSLYQRIEKRGYKILKIGSNKEILKSKDFTIDMYALIKEV